MQYNKRDLPTAVDFDYLRDAFNPPRVRRGSEHPTRVPDYEAIATMGKGVFDTLKAVAKQVLIELKRGR